MTQSLLEKFGITYSDPNHRYERFGVRLDSVSSVLPYTAMNEFLAAHPERIEKAGDRGRGVAEFIEDVEVRGCIPLTATQLVATPESAYLKFKRETGFTALVTERHGLASELFVYHDLLDYAGRLDIAGFAPNVCDGPGLVEVKATAVLPKTVGPQSAAYFEAFNRNAKFYGLPKLKWRAALHLTAKGYKFQLLKDPNDFARFCSCLTVTRWARELGLEIEWKEVNRAASPMGDAPSLDEVFV